MSQHTDFGLVIRRKELEFTAEEGCLVSRPVGPHVGAEFVSVDIVRIPRGASWKPAPYAVQEVTAIVFDGHGTAQIDGEGAEVRKGSTAYAPAGRSVAFTAAADGDADEMTVYFWRAPLPEGSPRGSAPLLFNTVYDESAAIRTFAGTGEIAPVDQERRAFMNFPHWPGNGCAHLCINSGMAAPGNTFNIHGHPGAEDALFALDGRGQFFLGDTWLDMEPGDGVYARSGVLHGTRNPAGPDAADLFVSVGGPVPYDPALYRAAGLSPEVV
ncbi:cupin domain-containing protein [Streptomyces sp. NRRL S-87]|uniref:cupin domain-containing protein n=1 Tax=Streptomyces sp. NRRL S-87 TaxID=1463920 RepID=UPI0004C1BA64|nr:cupin domain-containing protein [Streptomyces sp. NRRL S-87]